MQTISQTQSTATADRPTLSFSKEALALLPGGSTVRANALDQVSHAVYFR